MAHTHSVYDTDNHFVINPITKAIKNDSNSKVKLMQGDHNSERFTFEIPRYVEGHDMSLCDKVIMHFDNFDAVTKAESKGYFISKDVQLSPEDEDIVIFSYLIERTATKYGGSLNFLIEFVCTDSYAWNTDIYSGISVGKGIHNTEIDYEDNKDLLEQFKKDVLAEVDEKLASGGGSGSGTSFSGKASDVTYDDTETKLGATNVQDAIGQLSATINNLKGSEATGISAELTDVLKTYFANMQTLLTQLVYTTESHIGNTLMQNAKDVVTSLGSGTVEPSEPQPESGIVQTGSVLAITSGVTAAQTGSVLAIA